ncbi:septal ring lytic transglycosylase RlpA family protein [Lutibaculum baratangense]|nr:septal ring lytic transglycosylase RlpA family protein [Lutibaculum baratangense]
MQGAANPFRRIACAGFALTGALMLTACNGSTTAKVDPKLGYAASDPLFTTGPIAEADGTYKVGKPYKVAGKWYTPAEDPSYDKTGRASWYGRDFHGKQTANGEVFDMAGLSAAHPTLPLPSYARVTNLENGRSVVVRLNDRGPFAHGRLIDVSAKTAEVLGFKQDGAADVRVQFVGLAPSDGDDSWLTTTVRNGDDGVAPTMVASGAPAAGEGQATQQPDVPAAVPSLAWAATGGPDADAMRSFSSISGYQPVTVTGRNVVERAFAVFDGS